MNKWRAFHWKKIRGDKNLIFASAIIICFILIAILAPLIANERSPIVPFGPETSTASTKIYQAPGFEERKVEVTVTHLLGTDRIGRDVAARLMHGTRTTLQVGIISTAISFIIALILGTLAGYYGDRRLRLNVFSMVILLLTFVIGLPFLYYNCIDYSGGHFYPTKFIIILIIISCLAWIAIIINRKWRSPSLPFPIDTIIVKFLELFRAIPSLFLLLAIFSLVRHTTIWTVILVIGILRWGGMTRLLRAEIQRYGSESFVASAQVTGLSDWRIITRHLWPNALGPMLVTACFMVGNAILIEASLSFLGIGVPGDSVSWGAMLSASRFHISAWWLAVYPGFLIFLLILSFNILGDRLRKHLYKRVPNN